MHGQTFGTKIDLNDLTDFDTGSIPTGVNHTIKGTANIMPQSGMGPFNHEQQPPIPLQQFEQPIIPVEHIIESECVKNARHRETCPVCSRLYNDTTTYHNYVILFLLIVCIFLIKNLYAYHNKE